MTPEVSETTLKQVELFRRKASEIADKKINDEFTLAQIYVVPGCGIRKFENDRFTEEIIWLSDDIIKGTDTVFLEGKKLVIISAPSGMGKSSFCRMYAGKTAEEGNRIPLLVELRNFYPTGSDPTRKKAEELIGRYVKKELGITDYDKKAFEKALQEFPFLIIFDGLDEIPEVDNLRKIIRQLASIDGTDVRIIITASPDLFSPEVQKETKEFKRNDFIKLTIREFDDFQVKNWLDNWFTRIHPEMPAENRFSFSDIRSEKYRKELRTPLNLYLLARVLLKDRDSGMLLHGDHLERLMIYQHYIDRVIQDAGHLFEETPVQPVPDTYRRLLGELAYAILAQGKGETISEGDFVRLLPPSFHQHYSEIRKIRCAVLTPFEIRRQGRRISEDNIEGNFSFAHKTFREYLAAERILGVFLKAALESAEKNQDKYAAFINNRIFSDEITQFLEGLLDQVIDAVNSSQDVIDDSLTGKTGVLFRLYEIAGMKTADDYREIDKKLFEIACRWMQKDPVFLPESAGVPPSGEKMSLHLKESAAQHQNIQINSFLVASHLARKKFRGALPEEGAWLKKLLDQTFNESAVQWRLKEKLFGLDLRGAYMMGANLLGANLSEANLALTKLTGADLRGARLSKADLRAAVLNESNLNRANLMGANLFGANLAGTSLRGADLSNADLRGSFLYNPLYGAAKLQGAILEGTRFRREDLQNVDLSGVDLSRAIIEEDTQ